MLDFLVHTTNQETCKTASVSPSYIAPTNKQKNKKQVRKIPKEHGEIQISE